MERLEFEFGNQNWYKLRISGLQVLKGAVLWSMMYVVYMTLSNFQLCLGPPTYHY